MNIDPSLPSATLAIDRPGGSSQPVPDHNTLAPLLHPRPPIDQNFNHDESLAHHFPSAKRGRRRASSDSQGSESDEGSDSDLDESQQEDPRDDERAISSVGPPDREGQGASASKSVRVSASATERSKTKKQKRSGFTSSKHRRRSLRSSNGSDLRTSLDPMQLAQAFAIIQRERLARASETMLQSH